MRCCNRDLLHRAAGRRRRFVSVGLFLVFSTVSIVIAEEDSDRFILPETPPSIERLKKPPLDQPLVRKQNFISETEISLPPVLMDMDFNSFDDRRYPVYAGVYNGSFASRGGYFSFASPKGFGIRYATHYADGENERLSRERNEFSYDIERSIAPTAFAKGGIDIVENSVWNQRKSLSSLSSSLDYYINNDLNAKFEASAARGSAQGSETNDLLNGTFTLLWLPGETHSITFVYAPWRDTAFRDSSDLFDGELKYTAVTHPDLSVTGGLRYQRSTAYPEAEIDWHALPRVRCSLLYRPGIERPSWLEQYTNGRYLLTYHELPLPEAKFHLEEKLSFYEGGDSAADVSFTQTGWSNYPYWKKDAGTEYLSAGTLRERYVAGIEAKANRRWQKFNFRAQLSYASTGKVPFMPDSQLEAGVDYQLKSWSAGLTYRYVSSRRAAWDDPAELAAFNDVALQVKKTVYSGIELTLAGGNLLGETIETQPGFKQESPTVSAGLNVRF